MRWLARAITVSPVSSGWRSASSTCGWNSGSSSRNSTPRWASADLARPRPRAAADQRRHAGRMMRRAERPRPSPMRAARQLAGEAAAPCDTSSISAGVERRQDRRQPPRQHRLAGARRPDHQEVVAAGGGDLERALGGLLALDVREVGQRLVARLRAPARAARSVCSPLK